MKLIDQYLIIRQLREELKQKYGSQQHIGVGKYNLTFGADLIVFNNTETIIRFGSDKFSYLSFFTKTEQIYYNLTTNELIVSFNNHTEYKTIDYSKIDDDIIFQYSILIYDFEENYEVLQYCIKMYNETKDNSYLGIYDFDVLNMPNVFEELTTEMRRCIDNG